MSEIFSEAHERFRGYYRSSVMWARYSMLMRDILLQRKKTAEVSCFKFFEQLVLQIHIRLAVKIMLSPAVFCFKIKTMDSLWTHKSALSEMLRKSVILAADHSF